jgi:hypothetical protein
VPMVGMGGVERETPGGHKARQSPKCSELMWVGRRELAGVRREPWLLTEPPAFQPLGNKSLVKVFRHQTNGAGDAHTD